MKIIPIRTPIFKEGQKLSEFIKRHVKTIPDGSVLVITSKIMALSQKRVRAIINEKTREEIIRSESQWAMKTKYTWLTIKDGSILSSAGVDRSNGNGKIILLPERIYQSTKNLRNILKKTYKIRKLGIIITDSRLLPMRAGIVGITLAYSGFKGIKDYRGTKDIFGRMLKRSKVDVPDSLAAAAVYEMGEGAERQPLALITGAKVEFTDKDHPSELKVDPRQDIYLPLFEKIKKIKWKKNKNS